MSNPKGNISTLIPHKPKWRLGKTQTIRVPIAIADQILEAAKLLDEGETLVTVKELENKSIKEDCSSSTVTGDKQEIIEALKDLVALPSNRGGQIKIAAAKVAKLLGLNLEKTRKGWKIDETGE